MSVKEKLSSLKDAAKRKILGAKIKKNISEEEKQMLRCVQGNIILTKRLRERMAQAKDEIKRDDYKKAKRYLKATDDDEDMLMRNIKEIFMRSQKVEKLKAKASDLGVNLSSKAEKTDSAINF